MIRKFLPVYIVVVLTAFMLSSCTNGAWRAAYIQETETQIQMVDSAYRVFQNMKHDEITAVLDTVKEDLKFFDRNMTDELSFERAKLFSDYRIVTKHVKGYGHKHGRITVEFDRTQTQLYRLKDALEMRATEDADGVNIDESYIKKALQKETEVATSLKFETEKLNKGIENALEEYYKLRPAILEERMALEEKMNNTP